MIQPTHHMFAIVLGTRPEIIKTAPIVLEAMRRGIPVGIVHTGQHYSPEMDDVFFRELALPSPVAHAHVGSLGSAKQIGLMIERLTDIFLEMKPSVVVVQGDTNSVLAGAITAEKMGIPVAHVEAGLRSDDRAMPEEINRILTDHISRWLFCPTAHQQQRLANEGILHAGVSVTGNTIVDAVMHFSDIAREKSDVLSRLGVDGAYALLTMHRPSNVDDPDRLRSMIDAITVAARALSLRVVFPVHPRTAAILTRAKLVLPDDVFVRSEPCGFLDMLRLEQGASVILTDSGGVQEEACILRIPCVTLRANTERPETVDVGANVLHHEADAVSLERAIRAQMSVPRTWSNPFGDGRTAERIIDLLAQNS